jgi:hypothetical protein
MKSTLRVWLSELSEKIGAIVDLSSVPSAGWNAIAKFGLDRKMMWAQWEQGRCRGVEASRSSMLGNSRIEFEQEVVCATHSVLPFQVCS